MKKTLIVFLILAGLLFTVAAVHNPPTRTYLRRLLDGVYLRFTGDAIWTSDGSGVPYGAFYGNHIAWTNAGAVDEVWYNVVDSDFVTGDLNEMAHDGNGKLTVTYAGRYDVSWNATVEVNSANVHLDCGIEVGSSGTAITNGQGHVEIKFANQEETMSASTVVDLPASGTIELSIKTTDGGTPTLSLQSANMKATLLGGT